MHLDGAFDGGTLRNQVQEGRGTRVLVLIELWRVADAAPLGVVAMSAIDLRDAVVVETATLQ